MVEKKSAKKVTLEDLAGGLANLTKLAQANPRDIGVLSRTTVRGFSDVEEKMGVLRSEMDHRFDKVDGRLTTIDRRLDVMADDYGPRLKQLEKKVGITVD